ncbi:MAG TPA: hypothetical protein VE842_05965 [Pyrinomonadaceae bacterium]|jgi:hypothetical protein|nr:hypothetical protein [Pyrinomonadaceae bacterium]
MAIRLPFANIRPEARRRALILLLILALSFLVRGLTAQFMGPRLNDPGWFQSGSYKVFDERAQNILDGRERPFWIDDKTRTDLIQYPPAFPLWMAFIYAASGERSSYAVHRVHWVLDALSVLVIVGIGVAAYGWRVGLAGGWLAALSPLLALYGTWPSSDPLTTWLVLGAVWMLVLSAKGKSTGWAIGSGLMLGVACWMRVNPLLLAFFWALALLLFLQARWRPKARLAAALVLSTMFVISPVVVRNLVVFDDFAPTGLTIGTNLWEGLGEAQWGAAEGAPYGDTLMVERERAEMGLAQDFPLKPFWPDGIKRDRERGRRALAIIARHPLKYAALMGQRMWGMLKVAGEPSGFYGNAGINVTSRKCLPDGWQGGLSAMLVNTLGMMQSVFRYLALPLWAYGIWQAMRRDARITGVLLATVFYYLVPGAAAHTELRYVLPMHGLLVIFAGFSVCSLSETLYSVIKGRGDRRNRNEMEADKQAV